MAKQCNVPDCSADAVARSLCTRHYSWFQSTNPEKLATVEKYATEPGKRRGPTPTKKAGAKPARPARPAKPTAPTKNGGGQRGRIAEPDLVTAMVRAFHPAAEVVPIRDGHMVHTGSRIIILRFLGAVWTVETFEKVA